VLGCIEDMSTDATTQNNETEAPKEGKNNNSEKPEQAFIIALIVIVSFFLIFASTLFFLSEQMLEKVAALLSGIVMAVIGYYFGQRQSQAMSEQAKDASKQRDQLQKERDEIKSDEEELKNKIGPAVLKVPSETENSRKVLTDAINLIEKGITATLNKQEVDKIVNELEERKRKLSELKIEYTELSTSIM